MIKAVTLYGIGMLITLGFPFMHYTLYPDLTTYEKQAIAILSVLLAVLAVSVVDKFWRRPRKRRNQV